MFFAESSKWNLKGFLLKIDALSSGGISTCRLFEYKDKNFELAQTYTDWKQYEVIY